MLPGHRLEREVGGKANIVESTVIRSTGTTRLDPVSVAKAFHRVDEKRVEPSRDTEAACGLLRSFLRLEGPLPLSFGINLSGERPEMQKSKLTGLILEHTHPSYLKATE